MLEQPSELLIYWHGKGINNINTQNKICLLPSISCKNSLQKETTIAITVISSKTPKVFHLLSTPPPTLFYHFSLRWAHIHWFWL